jgi:[protein-PII] uridylyltransferase
MTRAPAPQTAQRHRLGQQRKERADWADGRLGELFGSASGDTGLDGAGVSLVAVGGYGRRELSPHSDLDIVLLHTSELDEISVARLAEKVWYPVWDQGYRLDHSVRSLDGATSAADSDPRVAMGLLDARHVAGDRALTLELRSQLRAQWRRRARSLVPELATLTRDRWRLVGDLAHLVVPDLKEAKGGLRDATALRALVATWLVDAPHAEVERLRATLLDVRDALHLVSNRASDRLRPEYLDEVTQVLGEDSRDTLRLRVTDAGRRIAHLSDLTWRRVEHALAKPSARSRRGPRQVVVAAGVAEQDGEVVLSSTARPGRDPLLMLRAAVAAGENDVMLSPVSAATLARECPPMPVPWPAEARDLFTRLLATGPPLVQVWESLDQAGATDLLFPEWAAVRSLPPESAVHRHTVDRHQIQACVEAASLVRSVSRPDLLLTAALLHDIGKGRHGDHSELGEVVAWDVAGRLGYDSGDAATIAMLVRHHLLLIETATRRDLADPTTTRQVADVVRTRSRLDLLAALTEADARATGSLAWTGWRRRLLADLVHRVRIDLGPTPLIERVPRARPVPRVTGDFLLDVVQDGEVATIEFAAPDRTGLLSAVAGSLALLNLQVRRADVRTERGVGASTWQVVAAEIDVARLREAIKLSLRGVGGSRLEQLPTGRPQLGPTVIVRDGASERATVVEVRAGDRPGLLHDICRILERNALDIRSAHLDTVGPQAVDVFYVCDRGGAPLGQSDIEMLLAALRSGLAEGASAWKPFEHGIR